MSARKANDDSHFFFVPLKARDILNTTARFPTQLNHSIDASVSCEGICASVVPGFPVQCTQACKVFNFEHDSTADNFSLINNSVTPRAPSPGVDAAVSLCPGEIAATNSDPTSLPRSPSETSALCGEASVSLLFSSLDDEVSTLEAEWLRDGIRMNARTLFNAACSSIDNNISASVSVE
jgi:hypothetical protein